MNILKAIFIKFPNIYVSSYLRMSTLSCCKPIPPDQSKWVFQDMNLNMLYFVFSLYSFCLFFNLCKYTIFFKSCKILFTLKLVNVVYICLIFFWRIYLPNIYFSLYVVNIWGTRIKCSTYYKNQFYRICFPKTKSNKWSKAK
jgi:hypothetical protein